MSTPAAPADPSPLGDGELAALRAEVLDAIRTRGYERRETPFELASGERSHDFVDGKRALGAGRDLRAACELIVESLRRAAIAFDAIGGLTMGADQFAHGVAVVCGCDWFVVRKAPKGRGTNKVVEGAEVAGRRVVVAEDVVTTGGSMLQACDRVTEAGGVVVAVVTLVDRGEVAGPVVAARGVPYFPLFTYHDLGIVPVGAARG